MKRTRPTAWLLYAGTALGVVVVVAGIATFVAASANAPAIWTAAVAAYLVQLAAFGLLIAFRDQPQLFLMAWAGGMVMRVAALGACAFLISGPRAPLLLGYVGFAFLLVIIEPVFLRWDLRT